MKKFCLVAMGAFALCVATSSTRCAAKTPDKTVVAQPKVKIDLSSPEATVRTFVAAINARDCDAARRCITVLNVKTQPTLDADVAELIKRELDQPVLESRKLVGPVAYKLSPIKVQISLKRPETVGDGAYVTGTVKISAASGNYSVRAIALSLLRMGKEWKIIDVWENLAAPKPLHDLGAEPLSEMVYILSAGLWPEQGAAVPAQAALSRDDLRRLMQSVNQFTQEADDKLDFSPADFYTPQKLKGYGRVFDIFHNPANGKLYSMNPNLTNAEVIKVQDRPIVLFYEGTNEQLDFGTDGTANVLLTNRVVKAVSREEAKSLIWKP